jgi:hypothetical protein
MYETLTSSDCDRPQLDASGFNQATNFHPFFGPVVMV